MIFLDETADNSVAEFRDRLRESPFFTDKTEIELAPMPNPDDFVREFTMLIELKEPI